jgi:hypothetical protein
MIPTPNILNLVEVLNIKIIEKTVIVIEASHSIRQVSVLKLACHGFRRLLWVVRNAKNLGQ